MRMDCSTRDLHTSHSPCIQASLGPIHGGITIGCYQRDVLTLSGSSTRQRNSFKSARVLSTCVLAYWISLYPSES